MNPSTKIVIDYLRSMEPRSSRTFLRIVSDLKDEIGKEEIRAILIEERAAKHVISQGYGVALSASYRAELNADRITSMPVRNVFGRELQAKNIPSSKGTRPGSDWSGYPSVNAPMSKSA
jgi:hypothetical protein